MNDFEKFGNPGLLYYGLEQLAPEGINEILSRAGK